MRTAAEAAARAGSLLGRVRAEAPAKGPPRRSVTPAGEIRALKRALSDADARLRESEARSARAQARFASRLERENEALEAQLTKLVQEIGATKHIVDRAQAREVEIRRLEEQVAELLAREAAWLEERTRLLAELGRTAGDSPASARAGAVLAAAAAGANAAGAAAEAGSKPRKEIS